MSLCELHNRSTVKVLGRGRAKVCRTTTMMGKDPLHPWTLKPESVDYSVVHPFKFFTPPETPGSSGVASNQQDRRTDRKQYAEKKPRVCKSSPSLRVKVRKQPSKYSHNPAKVRGQILPIKVSEYRYAVYGNGSRETNPHKAVANVHGAYPLIKVSGTVYMYPTEVPSGYQVYYRLFYRLTSQQGWRRDLTKTAYIYDDHG